MMDQAELMRRLECAALKIRLRCLISKSRAVRELYASLTSEIGDWTVDGRAEAWLRLLDLLEREFGPLWPRFPNVN